MPPLTVNEPFFPESTLDRKDNVSVYYLSVHGADYVLAPGLTLGEFASKCGQDQVIVDNDFLQKYAVLRHLAGRIKINRGYSSWLHHRENVYEGKPIDEVPKLSAHLFGAGADMVPLDCSLETLEELCHRVGFGGIKRYGTFVHADTGKKRTW